MTQGLDAITSAMGQRGSGNRNDSADAREGTSADTVATPSDFPSAYDYGTGHIDGYSREDMLRKMSEPSGNQTVMNTASDTGNIQALYLWEEGNVPAQTDFTSSMMGCFDDSDFRPYVTAIPVEQGVTPKGAVVLMAGGAYQFRGNYTDALPNAAALREEGFQTFIVNYRLRPYTPLYAGGGSLGRGACGSLYPSACL